MTSADLLIDGFDRVRDGVHEVVAGLTDELVYQVDVETNTIGWLIWHLTRVQDDHVCDAAGIEQAWTGRGWAERFGLPLDEQDTGFGHDSDDVATVEITDAELLTGYHDAVHERTIRYVRTLGDSDLTRIIDSSWNPPVSLGVRLVSVLADDLQHVGQADFVRGIVQRADLM